VAVPAWRQTVALLAQPADRSGGDSSVGEVMPDNTTVYSVVMFAIRSRLIDLAD
jgi:hypothetical protein